MSVNKFDFGSFSATPDAEVFTVAKNYTNPTSETHTRKELSFPLSELKDYINTKIFDEDEVNAVINTDLIPDATTSDKGLMSAADKTKLDGIEAGATVDDKKWNDVALNKTYQPKTDGAYIPYLDATNGVTAKLMYAKAQAVANAVPVYDSSARLHSYKIEESCSDDTLVTKKYVNDKISGVSGGSNVWTASYSNNGIYSASTLTTNEGDFVLSPGNKVIVTFTNVNGCEISSYSKLNVDGTGALSIRNLDGKVPSSGYQYQYSGVKDANIIAKDTTATFTYDGTYLVVDRYSPATPTEFGLTINNNGFGYALVTPYDIDPLDPTWMVKLTSASGVDIVLPDIGMHIPYVDIKMFTYTETDGAYECTPFTNFTYKINEPSIMPTDTGDVDLVITFGSVPATNVVICVHGNFTNFDPSYV